MNPRNLIPRILRLHFRLLKRRIHDLATGMHSEFSKAENETIEFLFSRKISQPTGKSQLVKSKIHNLKIASAKINKTVIKPGEIFSFWKIVGIPNSKNGYKKGRNLINGKLETGYGGGLCQLSGIIYFSALQTGLEIIERHNHSTDIYKDSERYTPLGSDATVVYAYKDLRIKNPFDFALKFDFEITETEVTGKLKSEQELQEKEVNFEYFFEKQTVKVLTKIENKIVSNSDYKRL